MRIKKNELSRFLVGLILIANIKFFSLPGSFVIIGSVCNYHTKILVCFLIMCFILVEGLNYKKDIFHKAVVYFSLLVFATFIYTYIFYDNQSIFSIIKRQYHLFAVWLVFPLITFLKRNENVKWMFRTIAFIGLAYSVYVILVKVVYSTIGVLLIDTKMQYVQTRDGSLRLARTATFISVSSVIAFCQFIKEFKVTKAILSLNSFSFALGTICVFYVGKTRVSELAIILSCFIVYILAYRRNTKFLIALLIIVTAPLLYQTIIEFYQSFYSRESIQGTEVRLAGYQYFLSHMFDGKIFGIGLVTSDSYWDLLYGSEGSYILSDLGYIGFLGVYGICGLAYLIFLLRMCVKILKKIIKNNKIEDYPECVGYLVFFGVSGFSLMFTDSQRCLYLPIFIVLYWIINEMTIDWSEFGTNEYKKSCNY